MAAVRQPVWRTLYFWVLVAIALGVLTGWAFPKFGESLEKLGTGFVSLVKMIITPVIFLTVVTGIAGMADLKAFGRVGLKAMAYFLAVSTLALTIGLIVANVVHPGQGMNADLQTLSASSVESAQGYATRAHDQSIGGFLLEIIPDTFFSAFTSGKILQVLFVSILFGIALALLGDKGAKLQDGLKVLTAVMFRIVHILMYAAPVGAFGAMAFTIGKYGIGSLGNLAALIGTFYATSLLFVILVLGTSSSESAMPSLMEKLERAGCPKPIVGLVVPTGYSFNLDGTNIYMTLAALFIAQACGVHMSFGDQLLLLAVAMLSSKGAAGVAGAGFITLAATLSVLPSVPVAGLALILGIDRFMSECRALTNFVGNAVATIVIARWEKGVSPETLRAAFRGEGGSFTELESDALQIEGQSDVTAR